MFPSSLTAAFGYWFRSLITGRSLFGSNKVVREHWLRHANKHKVMISIWEDGSKHWYKHIFGFDFRAIHIQVEERIGRMFFLPFPESRRTQLHSFAL